MSRRAALARLDDEPLLARSFDSLGLSLRGGLLNSRLQRLGRELKRKGLRFRPHAWLSSDFFVPDGVPGIALPFYLAHPRLMQLERAQSMGCEGQSERECLQLMRHETGHAIDNAYALHRRQAWRQLFGPRSAPYRQSYSADPSDRNFVRHLPHWYAQSHPAEDFAESFAVWLDPGSAWRSEYPSGGAREKLEWIESTMTEIGRQPASIECLEETEATAHDSTSLAEHYAARQRRRLREPVPAFAEPLAQALEHAERPLQRSSAAAHILQSHAAIERYLAPNWRRDAYSVRQITDAMQLTCRLHGLRLGRGRPLPKPSAMARWVEQSLEALKAGRSRLGR